MKECDWSPFSDLFASVLKPRIEENDGEREQRLLIFNRQKDRKKDRQKMGRVMRRGERDAVGPFLLSGSRHIH